MVLWWCWQWCWWWHSGVGGCVGGGVEVLGWHSGVEVMGWCWGVGGCVEVLGAA